MALREGCKPLLGLVCEIVDSVGQVNLHLPGKTQGISKPLTVATMTKTNIFKVVQTLPYFSDEFQKS